jgi:hypothetical protein
LLNSSGILCMLLQCVWQTIYNQILSVYHIIVCIYFHIIVLVLDESTLDEVFLYMVPILFRSWDSTVSIATGYRLDDRGRSSSPSRIKNILFSALSRLVLGPTQPPIQWVPGALSSEVKQPGREADHSPPASAKVKKLWIYTSTLPYTFMA